MPEGRRSASAKLGVGSDPNIAELLTRASRWPLGDCQPDHGPFSSRQGVAFFDQADPSDAK
jgi:hypothetical protein